MFYAIRFASHVRSICQPTTIALLNLWEEMPKGHIASVSSEIAMGTAWRLSLKAMGMTPHRAAITAVGRYARSQARQALACQGDEQTVEALLQMETSLYLAKALAERGLKHPDVRSHTEHEVREIHVAMDPLSDTEAAARRALCSFNS